MTNKFKEFVCSLIGHDYQSMKLVNNHNEVLVCKRCPQCYDQVNNKYFKIISQ